VATADARPRVVLVCVKNGGNLRWPRDRLTWSSSWGGRPRSKPVAGTRLLTWALNEPSERRIDGIERMRLVRDDIACRVTALTDELTNQPSPGAEASARVGTWP
jgi:hypothetical protein